MAETPEVGFKFGVEGDQSLLSTLQALRTELKNVQQQQQSTASSAEVLQRAWRGLIELAAVLKIAQFAHEVFDTAVALGKLSQITGISTKTLSVYYKAATDVGVAHEAVDKGLAKLSRSFVTLQAGNGAAAAGFRLLHLSAKDFIGLSADEKVRKVTDAFAAMKNGPEKAAAAIALFGKAGAQLIPVLNQLGGEEFAKLQEQAERLGLVFTQEMAEGALRAKAALADLKGVAEGATAQFETGLLPALANTADAMAHAITGTNGISNGFKTLGEIAGKAVASIAEYFHYVSVNAAVTGETLVEIFSSAWNEIRIGAISVFSAFDAATSGNFSGAVRSLKYGVRDAVNEFKDAVGRIHSLGEYETAQVNKFHDDLVSPKDRKLPKATGEPGDIKGAELDSSKLDRTEANALKQKAQDELTLYRDLSREKQEQDKRDYDQGLISLEEYFGRRRNAITDAFMDEIKSLGAEKLSLQDLLSKAEGAGGKTPQQQLANQREIMQLKQQIAHIDAETADEVVKRDIELAKVEDERARAKQDHLLKELEAQKKLADLEGDRVKAAELASQIEDLQLRKELEQLGKTKAEIDAFLARTDSARGIRAAGSTAQQGFEGGEAGLAARKAAIEEQVSLGTLMPYEAERRLAELYRAEIVDLEKKVQLIREQAALADKNKDAGLAADLTKQADQDETKLLKLRAEMARMDTTWMSWRTQAFSSIDQVSQHLTTGLNGWIQGQQRFGDALKKTWNGIVMTAIESLEHIAAQFIAYHLKMLIMKRVTDQEQVASTAASAAEKEGIEKTSGMKSILKSAKIAAAKAWEALANIPIIGPALGAIAAAATFVAVMALGAFAEGGYVGGGSPHTVAFRRRRTNDRTQHARRRISSRAGQFDQRLHPRDAQRSRVCGKRERSLERGRGRPRHDQPRGAPRRVSSSDSTSRALQRSRVQRVCRRGHCSQFTAIEWRRRHQRTHAQRDPLEFDRQQRFSRPH
jgi:hypothetical protein